MGSCGFMTPKGNGRLCQRAAQRPDLFECECFNAAPVSVVHFKLVIYLDCLINHHPAKEKMLFLLTTLGFVGRNVNDCIIEIKIILIIAIPIVKPVTGKNAL